MSLWNIEDALLGEILCVKYKFSSNVNKYPIVKVEINNSGTVFNLNVLISTTSRDVYYFTFAEISDLISGKTVCKDNAEYKIEN